MMKTEEEEMEKATGLRMQVTHDKTINHGDHGGYHGGAKGRDAMRAGAGRKRGSETAPQAAR